MLWVYIFKLVVLDAKLKKKIKSNLHLPAFSQVIPETVLSVEDISAGLMSHGAQWFPRWKAVSKVHIHVAPLITCMCVLIVDNIIHAVDLKYSNAILILSPWIRKCIREESKWDWDVLIVLCCTVNVSGLRTGCQISSWFVTLLQSVCGQLLYLVLCVKLVFHVKYGCGCGHGFLKSQLSYTFISQVTQSHWLSLVHL